MPRSTKSTSSRWLGVLWLCFLAMLARADDTNDLAALTRDLGISLWDKSFSIRNGVGYDDNVLLDNARVRGSGFFDNGLDATVYRLPLGAWEYYYFLSGDDLRYWRNIGVGSQDNWIGAAKIDRVFSDDWKAGATFSYAYQDQILDLLTTEGVTAKTPTKVIGNMLSLRPFLRRNLGSNYWVELEAEGVRQFYGSPAFSYWRAGPRISFGRDYGFHSQISLSYGVFDQPFDNEPRAAANGTNLPGARLEYLTQRAELLWRHHYGASHTWESTVRLNFDSVNDNASGYYNFYRYGASAELDYEAHGWKITAQGDLRYYNYPHQTADDPELSALYETGFTASLHVERRITKWLKLFADYEFEHTFSDDSVEEYAVNTFKGGLQWEF